MIIGVPKEVKTDEYRIALLPVGAELLTRDGHTVLIEKEAGPSSGFDDRAVCAGRCARSSSPPTRSTPGPT